MSGWGLALLSAVLIAVYWPTSASLLTKWTTPGAYDHGWVAVAGAVWLTWRRAIVGEPMSAAGAFNVCVILFGFTLAWSLALLANVTVAQQVLWVGIVFLLAIALGGGATARRLALPFALLTLAIPIWDYAIPLLQHVAVFGSMAAVVAAGIPAAIDGNTIEIPAGFFLIEGGCSGLRYFLSAVTLALLAGELVSASVLGRWTLVGVAAASAVVGNWLRILIVVMIGDATNMRHELVEDHFWIGWLTFAVLVPPSLLLAARVVPQLDSRRPQGSQLPVVPHPSLPRLAVICLVLLAVPAGARLVEVTRYRGAAATAQLPAGTAGWVGPLEVRCPWQRLARSADVDICALYESPTSGPVFVSVVAYLRQAPGRELIGGIETRPEGEWLASSRAMMETQAQPPVVMAQTVTARGAGPWRMWYWYGLDSMTTPRPLVMKLAEAVVLRFAEPASLTIITAPCRGDCRVADSALSQYLDAHAGLADAVGLLEARDSGDNATVKVR